MHKDFKNSSKITLKILVDFSLLGVVNRNLNAAFVQISRGICHEQILTQNQFRRVCWKRSLPRSRPSRRAPWATLDASTTFWHHGTASATWASTWCPPSVPRQSKLAPRATNWALGLNATIPATSPPKVTMAPNRPLTLDSSGSRRWACTTIQRGRASLASGNKSDCTQ